MNQMNQMNGGGGQPQNGGGGVPLVNGLPSGGQQTDMNHLWSVVQQLSQMLEENKAATQGVLSGVAALQARGLEAGGEGLDALLGGRGGEGGRENGENAGTSPHTLTCSRRAALHAFRGRTTHTHTQNQTSILTQRPAARAAELSTLRTHLATSQTTILSLESHTSSLTSLVTDYENALTLLLDKLRPFAYTHTSSILALHKHYNALLDAERATSMKLRLEHAEWQAGLGRVAEYARKAVGEVGRGEEGWVRENRALREENRVLRGLVGWEERGGSSDEEEGERA